MDIENEIKQQRWSMMTNPYSLKVEPMCRVTEEEIQEHCFLLDATTSGQQMSKLEMDLCRQRFRRFCSTQWENKNIN